MSILLTVIKNINARALVFPATMSIIANLVSHAALSDDNIHQSFKATHQTQLMAEQSQAKVSQLADEQRKLLADYQRFENQADYQQAYNDELRQKIVAQQENLSQLRDEINTLALTKQQLLPLLRKMTQSLEAFIKVDLPFQRQARLESIAQLKAFLNEPEASVADKFRRVFEQYQTENDANYQLASGQTEIVTTSGQAMRVALLRVGRIALYYQSLDQSSQAIWDPAQQDWRALDTSYARAITQGIRIALDQATPELLELPLLTRANHNTTKGEQ